MKPSEVLSLNWHFHRAVQGVPKKTQHLIKWYRSVVIYAISSISWYCRIGNTLLHNYVKFHYQNRSGYFKNQLLDRFTQVLAEASHLLQINPFTTKVSAAKHIYVLNLSIFSSPGTKCQGELLGWSSVCRSSSSCVVRRASSTIYLNIFSETTDEKVIKLGTDVP